MTLAAELEIFTDLGGEFVSRWIHVLVGITWIGLLYYFNFVQTPAFAEFDANSRNVAVDKLASRALWWFRWSAFATFLMGLLILYFQDNLGSNSADYFKTAPGVSISTGVLMGTIMMLNVWGVIWPKQKRVIANARNVLAGGEADSGVAPHARVSGMASRQNTIFSFPMLLFMVGTSHFFGLYDSSSGGDRAIYWVITLVVIALLELNALGVFGTSPGALRWIYDDHKNAITTGIILTIAWYGLFEILFRV